MAEVIYWNRLIYETKKNIKRVFKNKKKEINIWLHKFIRNKFTKTFDYLENLVSVAIFLSKSKIQPILEKKTQFSLK